MSHFGPLDDDNGFHFSVTECVTWVVILCTNQNLFHLVRYYYMKRRLEKCNWSSEQTEQNRRQDVGLPQGRLDFDFLSFSHHFNIFLTVGISLNFCAITLTCTYILTRAFSLPAPDFRSLFILFSLKNYILNLALSPWL